MWSKCPNCAGQLYCTRLYFLVILHHLPFASSSSLALTGWFVHLAEQRSDPEASSGFLCVSRVGGTPHRNRKDWVRGSRDRGGGPPGFLTPSTVPYGSPIRSVGKIGPAQKSLLSHSASAGPWLRLHGARLPRGPPLQKEKGTTLQREDTIEKGPGSDVK